MNKRRATVIAALGLATAALAWAQNTLRPGQYEMMVEMQLPGAAQPMTMAQMACLTAEEARDFQSLMNQQMGGVEGCTFSDPQTTGNKMTWSTTCDDVTATSELAFLPDGFTVLTRSTVQGTAITANVTAKWLSTTCTVPDDE
jgi:hypothetical protein